MGFIEEALKVSEEYAADCRELKEKIPELERYSLKEIELLYKAYSNMFAAGWLIVDDEEIEKFRRTL